MSNLEIIDLYDKYDNKKIDSFCNNIDSNLRVVTNYDRVNCSFEWLDIMEDTIQYLDNILRNPNRFIVNEEEIVKVEQARKITVETIKHLSKHTNYIQEIDKIEEPIAKSDIIVPKEFVGNIMELAQERRGKFINMKYIDDSRVNLEYEIPLNEIIYDFFNSLKSRSKGYASFDYEISHYEKSNLVKLDILLNGDVVDALSFIVHRSKAETRGRKIAEKLKEIIPRQLFEIPIQAAIGGKVVARETVKALRKDVLAKCYGGDITRKKKLLEKQKEGKKRMRQVGNVELPQDAFMTALKVDE